jgi:hypothetical protein
MKPRLFFWTVSLIIVLAASACASAQSISTPIVEAPPVEALPATAAPGSNCSSSYRSQQRGCASRCHFPRP